MIQNRIFSRFSSIRIFSNIFTVTNDKYTLSADITPPTTYTDEKQEVRIKFTSSLLFSVIKTTQKYQKGAKADYFVFKNIEMLELGCWDWRQGGFEQVNNYKAVIGSLKEVNGVKQISMVFFDKNEKDGNNKKQFFVKPAQFLHFQNLITSGINEYSNLRISQMSTINSLINKINVK